MDTMVADLPVSVAFFFRQPLDQARLAHGLAEALDRIPLFAGRLRQTDTDLDIICDDSGVPMTSFDIDESLGEASSRVTLPFSDLVERVEATRARVRPRPLMTVRLTHLADGGTVLGCSWHHAVGDVQSFMLFMRTWSACVEGTRPPDVRIVADRDVYLDGLLPDEDSARPGFRLPDPAEAAVLMREVKAALTANRTLQIYFAVDEIARMRREFSQVAGCSLSRSDTICAHLVSVVRQLDDDTEPRHLAMPVDIRRRLGLSPAILGNPLDEIYLSCAPNVAPGVLAAEIRAAVNDFARSHLSFRANRAFLEKVGRSRLRYCVPLSFDPVRRTFTFSNWSGSGAYDIVFGGQRPILFSPIPALQLPWVSCLVEGFAGSGHLATVALSSQLAARLCSPEGVAALHRYREPADNMPMLTTAMRNLI
jgi:Transferase family